MDVTDPQAVKCPRTKKKGAGAKKRQQERYRLRKEQERAEKAAKISQDEHLYFASDPRTSGSSVGVALRRMDRIRNINPHIQFEPTDTMRDVRRRVENARFEAFHDQALNAFKKQLMDNDVMSFESGLHIDCERNRDAILVRYPFKKVCDDEPMYLEDSFLQGLFLNGPITSVNLTASVELRSVGKCCAYTKWQRKQVISDTIVPDSMVFASKQTEKFSLIGLENSVVPRAVIRVRTKTHVLLDHYWYHYYVWDTRFGYTSSEEIKFYDVDCCYAWKAYHLANGLKYNCSSVAAPGLKIDLLSIFQIRFITSRGLLLPRLDPPLYVTATKGNRSTSLRVDSSTY